ncbi:MAG TPA: sigma-70 family RNA polymerase sigma factor [Chloroflexota bacterium]
MEELGELRGARALPWASVAFPRTGKIAPGDLREFESVYQACLPIVLRYMLARVRDPVLAEDLTGDVFERAVRAWPTFEHRSAPATWILSIAHHVVSHHWRQARTQPVQLEDRVWGHLNDDGLTPEDEVQRRVEVETLHRTVAELPAKEQELLALRFAADLPFRDIAIVLGVREVTVRVRMHRAMRRLERLLRAVEERP